MDNHHHRPSIKMISTQGTFARVFSALKDALRDFMTHTSSHGAKYTSEDDRKPFERLVLTYFLLSDEHKLWVYKSHFLLVTLNYTLAGFCSHGRDPTTFSRATSGPRSIFFFQLLVVDSRCCSNKIMFLRPLGTVCPGKHCQVSVVTTKSGWWVTSVRKDTTGVTGLFYRPLQKRFSKG